MKKGISKKMGDSIPYTEIRPGSGRETLEIYRTMMK